MVILLPLVEIEQSMSGNSTLMELYDRKSYTISPRKVAVIREALPRISFSPQEAGLFIEQVLATSDPGDKRYDQELADKKYVVLQTQESAHAEIARACMFCNIGVLGYWIRNARKQGYRVSSENVAELFAIVYDDFAASNRRTLNTPHHENESGVYQQAKEQNMLNTTRKELLNRAREILGVSQKSHLN